MSLKENIAHLKIFKEKSDDPSRSPGEWQAQSQSRINAVRSLDFFPQIFSWKLKYKSSVKLGIRKLQLHKCLEI
jgi:hypothetical protein